MDKRLSCAGLAKKAGKLLTGTAKTIDAVRNGKARLVITASDASENTVKLIHDKSSFYKVPEADAGATCAELGKALGCAVCACAAFTDENFAGMFERAIKNSGGNIHG